MADKTIVSRTLRETACVTGENWLPITQVPVLTFWQSSLTLNWTGPAQASSHAWLRALASAMKPAGYSCYHPPLSLIQQAWFFKISFIIERDQFILQTWQTFLTSPRKNAKNQNKKPGWGSSCVSIVSVHTHVSQTVSRCRQQQKLNWLFSLSEPS